MCQRRADVEHRRMDVQMASKLPTARLLNHQTRFVAERYAKGPSRVQYENKDPRGHAEFVRMLAEHSATGSANTQAGVQKERPSLSIVLSFR